MSLIGRQHVLSDELLDAHKNWFIQATSGYGAHIEGTVEEWLERVRIELVPRQRVQLLVFIAWRYTGCDDNNNSHVTISFLRQVDKTYAFLLLAWWLCSQQHEHSHRSNRPSKLLPIMLETYTSNVAPSQEQYDRLRMQHFYARLWHYFGNPSTNNGRLMRVLRDENTSYHPRPGGCPHEQLAHNWDQCVREHILKLDRQWQAEAATNLHQLFPAVLAQMTLAYVPPLVLAA